MRTYIWCGAAVAVLGLGVLAGCDDRLAMQPARDHRSVGGSITEQASSAPASAGDTGGGGRSQSASYGRDDSRPEAVAAGPVPTVQGAPLWSDSRRYTAEQNAQYQFEHHGSELGAHDLDDFVQKVHHFVATPPEGVLTLTRGNGDKLLFDPKSGLFGVVRSDGAPRTVFKPDNGKAYWDQQVATKGERPNTTYRRTEARRGGDDQG